MNLPTGRLFKCLPILAGDEVVDDRIDGRVEIKEYSSNVHQLLICYKVNFLRNPLESKLRINEELSTEITDLEACLGQRYWWNLYYKCFETKINYIYYEVFTQKSFLQCHNVSGA